MRLSVGCLKEADWMKTSKDKEDIANNWTQHVPVSTEKYRRLINTEFLSSQEKRTLWEDVKCNHPATAELLVDPGFLAIKAAFNGHVVFDYEEFKGCLE